jgi:hypothetical protein
LVQQPAGQWPKSRGGRSATVPLPASPGLVQARLHGPGFTPHPTQILIFTHKYFSFLFWRIYHRLFFAFPAFSPCLHLPDRSHALPDTGIQIFTSKLFDMLFYHVLRLTLRASHRIYSTPFSKLYPAQNPAVGRRRHKPSHADRHRQSIFIFLFDAHFNSPDFCPCTPHL